MKPRAITDVAIKELSLIVPEHKGKQFEPINQDAQVLMVKGAEKTAKGDEKKNAIVKAFETLKGYFMADYQPFEPAPFPVSEAEDNIDNDGDGPEDYNAIVSAVCCLYCDLQAAMCISDDSGRSSAIVQCIDKFLAGLDALRSGDDEKAAQKAGARHSKADAAHIAAIAAAHAKMAEHIAALQPEQKDGEQAGKASVVSAAVTLIADAVVDADKAKEKPKGDYGSDDEAGYADPGYQSDKKPRYPLKENGKLSAERVRAAWSYVNQKDNAAEYSSDDLDKIKNRIRAAAKEVGVEISDSKAAEVDMTEDQIKALVADAAKAAAQEAAQATADAVKAQLQPQIDAAKAEAQTAKTEMESAKAEAKEAKTAADVQTELAEQYKAESQERAAIIKAAAGLAAKPTASSATASGGESRLMQVFKAQLAQNPESHRF